MEGSAYQALKSNRKHTYTHTPVLMYLMCIELSKYILSS